MQRHCGICMAESWQAQLPNCIQCGRLFCEMCRDDAESRLCCKCETKLRERGVSDEDHPTATS